MADREVGSTYLEVAFVKTKGESNTESVSLSANGRWSDNCECIHFHS